MKVVTLRNVPVALTRVIRRRAAQERTSINKTVIRLLEESVASRPRDSGNKDARHPPYHDLDGLAGRWGKEEAAAFEKSLHSQRVIDPELWK